MFKENNKISKGRPVGSLNKVTNNLKLILEELAQDLHKSIDISKLKDSERMKLFVSILPYLMPKKQEIENTNSDTNLNWIENWTEEQLEILLKNT
jgi:hypothetical protein